MTLKMAVNDFNGESMDLTWISMGFSGPYQVVVPNSTISSHRNWGHIAHGPWAKHGGH